MAMLKNLFLVLASGCYLSAHAGPTTLQREVNEVRRATGLPILSVSKVLERAALSHANYLARHLPIGTSTLVSAHEQRQGKSGYTGHFAADRAAYFDYPHSQVLENISIGNDTVENSVADLMSAIYHRFAFLDFDIDEIGGASVDRRYVYKLGMRDLAQICEQQPSEARAKQPVDCLGKAMLPSAYETLCANLPKVAKFRPPYPNRCANGELLRAEFMQKICDKPPKAAILNGAGRYFDACGDGTRIKAKWLEKMCKSGRDDVIYPYTGEVYRICEPPVEVHARWYRAFCENLPSDQQSRDSGHFYQVCQNGFKIKAEYFDAQATKRLLNRPQVVVWPPDGAQDIKPVFYDEDPHPTPDLPMTGYPISIQFNPQTVSEVKIMGFTLERQSGDDSASWIPLDKMRQISATNDIQYKFTKHQFAWFPLQRLDWGANYRFQIDALVNGGFQRYSSQFSTAGFNLPQYSVAADSDELKIAESRFILYRAPDNQEAFPFQDVELSADRRTRIEARVIDPNTVELMIDGGGCAPVRLRTQLGRQITINRCEGRGWRSLF